jgi:hypothetical protein
MLANILKRQQQFTKAEPKAGKLCGMDRQTLRDWVIRYNAEGIAGLCNHRAVLLRNIVRVSEAARTKRL